MLQPSQFPKGVLGHIHRNADDVIPILPEGPHCLEAFNSSVRGLNSNTPSEAVARSHASALIMGEAAKHARMGSNLGLPITLRLAQAMRASVGLLEVCVHCLFSACRARAIVVLLSCRRLRERHSGSL